MPNDKKNIKVRDQKPASDPKGGHHHGPGHHLPQGKGGGTGLPGGPSVQGKGSHKGEQ